MHGRLGRLALQLTIVGLLGFWLAACGETDSGARNVAPPSVDNPCPPTAAGDATGGNVQGPGGGSTGESGGVSQPGTTEGSGDASGGTTGGSDASGGTTGESGGSGDTTGNGVDAGGGATGNAGGNAGSTTGGAGNGGSSGMSGGGTSSGATGSDPASENGAAAPCPTPGQ